MKNPNPGRVLISEESSGPKAETPPAPDENLSKETVESSPADSPAPAQKSPSPSQEHGSPPPASSKANPPPKTSLPPASSPPASSTTSPPSGASSSPPPPASPPPVSSGGSSKHPPPSHPPPPNESPKSKTPPPPVSKSSPSHPPPASPHPPSSPDTPVISPPSDSSDTSTPPPPATNASPPPAGKKSGSPPAEKGSPPSAEGPSKAVPTPPHASSSPPAASTKTPTSSNVPPSKSTTSDNVPKLSPPSAKSTSDSSTSSQEGPIIGFTVAGVVIVAFFIFCCVARRRRKRQEAFLAQYKPPPNNLSVQPDGYYYQSPSGQADTYFTGKPMATPGHVNGYANNGGYSPGADANVMGAKSSFSYEELMEITNGFSQNNILGEGGFGCVYKGWLPDGRVVAVKQLKAGSGQGEREFQAEVEIISRVHHRHLVSLVGYCIAERQRLLVYEFVPNNTLEHHLHGKGVPVMEWSQRVKLAIGAARGLAYLHEDCHPKIIHRDIKSANILLDDDFEAQVADFGLAKLTNDTSTHVSTRVMGTFGYMAPEYASSGKLTDRSDVYSFGVVLLELVTGRKSVDATQPLGDESLVEWARPLLNHAIESGDFEELVDSRLEGRFVESEMRRMIETAAACVRHSAQKRPRMSQVVRALDTEGEMGDLTNGVKVGQSTIFEANKRSADMEQFRRLALGGDSTEFSMYSGESNSREVPLKSKSSWSDDSSECSSAGKLMA